MGTRGVWTLENVEIKYPQDDWVSLPGVWTGENQNVGYTKFYNHFQYRINFTTEVSTVTTHLPTVRLSSAGTSNATDAYFIGGEPGPAVSDAIKITYATDTSADTPSARSHIPINAMGALAGQDHSYLFGGFPSGSTHANKLVFSNDTTSNLPGSQLAAAVYNVQTGTAGGADGYIYAGGTSDYSETQKITFANDTRVTLPSSSRMDMIDENGSGDGIPYWGAGKMQCSTHCYYAGGNPSGGNFTSTFQKLTFANETWAVNPSKMARSLRYIGGFTVSSTQGSIAGGQSPSGWGSATSNVDFVTFATDVWQTSPSMTLPSTPGGVAGAYNNQVAATTIHDSMHSGNPGLPKANIKRWFDDTLPTPNFGYSVAGRSGPSPAYGDKAYKIDFSNDTPSAAPSVDYLQSTHLSFGGGSSTKGYIMGGTDGSPSDGESRVMRITYSTEASTAVPNLGARRYGSFSMTHGNTALYLQGGRNPTYSDTRKMAYSAETWSSVPSGAHLNHYIYNGASGASATDGYAIMGNYDPGPQIRTSIDKLTFSSDTTAIQPSAGMPIEVMENRGLSESTGVYSVAGKKTGSDDTTVIQKLVFSTGTSSLSTNLTSVRYNMQTVGRNTRGYVAGGMTYNSPQYHSYVDKFVYATSTVSATSSNLPDEQAQGAGVSGGSDNLPFFEPPTATPTSSTTLTGPQGIKNEGYLIQGVQGPTGMAASSRSDVYRLDYSTETWDSSVFANSTLVRRRGGASSTTTNAYIGGGVLSSVDGSPTGGDMDKLTYATSTMSRIPGSDAGRITTSRGNDGQPAAGNQNLGYWGGGYGVPGAGRSHVDKFVYSSETASSLPNWPWPQNNKGVAVAMQTHAYLGGGPSETGTNFVKITFANDTYSSKNGWTETPGGPAEFRGATSSPTKAYIVGGQDMERRMDVTTWANDTTSNSPSTFLASPGFYMAPGQGSDQAGYFTGGANTGNNGTTTEKITFSTDTSAILPGAYFSSSSPAGVNSYSTGGPNMNGVGNTVPNVI